MLAGTRQCGTATRRYCAPTVDGGDRIEIQAGRHPVIEATQTDVTFVPNDTVLDRKDQSVGIITGPNMAGKSTYIRQTALIVLLAQVGAYVPATSAKIGVVDRIFTRIGAADDLSRGASTFMVEMVEIANILNNAGARSLVILDEVGRGTSTFDGLALAWAIVEHMHDAVRARTLFATHYHQLTELAESHRGVHNLSVAVREWEDEIVFLHQIVQGGTDRSYGIQVARLAGVPQELIGRAREVLRDIERDSDDLGGRIQRAALAAALPAPSRRAPARPVRPRAERAGARHRRPRDRGDDPDGGAPGPRAAQGAPRARVLSATAAAGSDSGPGPAVAAPVTRRRDRAADPGAGRHLAARRRRRALRSAQEPSPTPVTFAGQLAPRP